VAGSDIIAAEDPTLASIPDEELLRAATRANRAVVTENDRDFDRIVRSRAATGEHHAGVVWASPRRFHRGSAAYPADLVAALDHWLSDPAGEGKDWIYWLP